MSKICYTRWARGALALSVCALFTSARAEESETTVEPLAIARLLLRDGLPERAEAALTEVDTTQEDFEAGEFALLEGLIRYELEKYAEAAQSFERAKNLGDQRPSTRISLAAARYGAGQYDHVIALLADAGPEVMGSLRAHRLLSTAYYQKGDKLSAHRAIRQAEAAFPGDKELIRQEVRLLIELGLHQHALERAQSVLEGEGAESRDYVAIATALAESNAVDRSIALMEQALVRFPNDPALRKDLARFYLRAERPFTAARVIEALAFVDGATAMHTAELYRRAGDLDRAIELNAFVSDQKEKTRQRLNLLIEDQRYEEAAALEERLARLDLLEDSKIAYALAYALFMTGNHGAVERIVSRITDPELFEKSIELRRAIETCKQDVWRCL